MTRTLARTTLLLFLGGCSACSGGGTDPGDGGGPAPCTFVNPLASGADPWVVRADSFYYYIQSRNNGIYVSRSKSLTGVITASATRVWSAPATGWNQTNIWAPELHRIDGHWYIYYAGGQPSTVGFIHQRAGVLEAATDDPQGAYIDRGMLYTGDDVAAGTDPKWAIDLTVDRIGGQLYAVWSGWAQNSTTTDRVPQNLYIAPMSDPLTISGNRVQISAPTADWERGTELDLEEGPEILQHGAQTLIIYSTRESWLPAYRLGQLRLTSATADPLSGASWTKSGPVFQGAPDVYGVGHASFTVSPDSTESWIVYHSKVSSSPGWDRNVRMQRFTWNADDTPSFGTPAPTGQRLAMPAGQCP